MERARAGDRDAILLRPKTAWPRKSRPADPCRDHWQHGKPADFSEPRDAGKREDAGSHRAVPSEDRLREPPRRRAAEKNAEKKFVSEFSSAFFSAHSASRRLHLAANDRSMSSAAAFEFKLRAALFGPIACGRICRAGHLRARRCGRRNNLAGLAAGWPADGRLDSRRNRPMRDMNAGAAMPFVAASATTLRQFAWLFRICSLKYGSSSRFTRLGSFV